VRVGMTRPDTPTASSIILGSTMLCIATWLTRCTGKESSR
jgi:hypothetical protein